MVRTFSIWHFGLLWHRANTILIWNNYFLVVFLSHVGPGLFKELFVILSAVPKRRTIAHTCHFGYGVLQRLGHKVNLWSRRCRTPLYFLATLYFTHGSPHIEVIGTEIRMMVISRPEQDIAELHHLVWHELGLSFLLSLTEINVDFLCEITNCYRFLCENNLLLCFHHLK